MSRFSVGAEHASELDIQLESGAIRGITERGIRAWRGIPYAGPAGGANRFRAPTPVVPWQGVRDCTRWGPVATQLHKGQFVGAAPHIPQGEDCLNLNVLAPDAPIDPTALRPVMVFIHGGGYSVGSSREEPRRGEALVRAGGVVYVSMNYRLGGLGYLDFSRYSTPERPFESNLGLRDQAAALRWVHDNIRSFGGDPDAVTLFGESAGGNAVTTLMTVPSAAGLFERAIAQSASANAVYPPEITAAWAEEFVAILRELVKDATTDAAALLATAAPETLALATSTLTQQAPDRAPGTTPLCPVIDGDFLPERPLDSFRDGRAHPIPLIIGTNAREGSLFSGRMDILASTPERIRAIFAKTPPEARLAIAAHYPGIPDRPAALDFAGDYSFWYPSVKVAEKHSRHAPVWFYRFDAAPPLVRRLGLDATHGLEMYPLFDGLNGWMGRGMTLLGGRRLFKSIGARMRRWWLSFAETGDPDPAWPRYDETTRATLIIDKVDRVERDPWQDRRRAWRAFVPHI